MRRKHWPRHGGLGLGLGVGGGGVGYLLNDSFLTNKAAGLVDGTAAEPGPGTRTVVDTDGAPHLSIAGGKLVFNGGKAAPAYGDPGIWYPTVTRLLGRMQVGNITIDDVTKIIEVGFDANTVGSRTRGALQFNADIIKPIAAATAGPKIYVTTDGTNYKYAIILREAGTYYLLKDTYWKLLYSDAVDNNSPIYPGASNYSAVASLDFIRVPTLLWTPRPISADAFGGTWPTTDGGGLTGLEAGGSGKTWTTAVGATWSNSGGFAVNAPGVGGELLVNGSFTGWSGAPPNERPDNWSCTGSGAAYYVTPDPAGKCRMVTDGTSIEIYQTASAANRWQRYSIGIDTVTAGGVQLANTAAGPPTFTTTGTKTGTFRSSSTNVGIKRAGAMDVTFDDYSMQLLTTAELIQVIDNGVTDFYAEIDITAAEGFQAGIVFNYVDSSNFEVVYLNRNDNKVYWDQCVAGTYTNINTSAAVTPGAGYKLAVRRIGTSLYYWYNNIYVHNNTIVSTLNTTSQGLFSTGNGATEVKFDNWKLYAVGSGGEYSLLDMFCN